MTTELKKAELIELEQLPQQAPRVKSKGKTVKVQFNPESLKVSFANQVQQPKSGGNQSEGTASQQFVGSGTTKLSLQLWFDVTVLEKVEDVRRLTGQVTYFMVAQSTGAANNLAPPMVRFQWGSFVFDGLIDSLEESLEFFSDQGQPLRASMTLSMSQQKVVQPSADGAAPNLGGAAGARPLFEAKAGASLPSIAAAAGLGDWQSIARANGIENPRQLDPGRLIDLNLRIPRRD